LLRAQRPQDSVLILRSVLLFQLPLILLLPL
jgi:hypothetical protein